MGGAEPNALTPRKRRAVALVAAATILIIAAGVVYLRTSPPTFAPPANLPGINPHEATTDFVMYDFTSPLAGWALDYPINPPHDVAGQFYVLRTTDGGKRWQMRLTGQSSYSFAPESVHFFDEAHGFVYLGASPAQLFRTSDGGAHWKSAVLPEQAVQVRFWDPSHGWLLSQSTTGQRAHLYATSDAGDSWQPLPDPPFATYGLAVRRNSEAWLASSGPTSGQGPPRVYLSTDGGLTWQPHDLPLDTAAAAAGPWIALVRLLPGNAVIASASCQCAFQSRDFTSFDRGETWRVVPAPPRARFLGSLPFVVAYQDDTHWWAIDAQTLYRSTDAGQTWTLVSDRLPDWQFFEPYAIDTKHAWAQITIVGGYGLALTNDAGLHWTRVAVPHPSSPR